MKNILALFIAATAFAGLVYADEMSSQHFSITSDSVNVGGIRSTSTNYGLEDTAGDVATGISTSTNFNLYAGYQKQEVSDIYLTPGSNVTMVTSLGGLTGGTANGSSTFTVLSYDDAGYLVNIRAEGSPALTSGANSFADYTPAGSDPDFSFSIAPTASEFGYSPEGDDITARYKDNGASCNAGSSDTSDACWDAFSTSDQTIVERLSSTASTGSPTTIKFRAAIGASHIQPQGVYVATTTITILPL